MGGAIEAWMSSNVTVKNTIFFNNRAGQYGGAVRLQENCTITLLNSKFCQNSATKHGGATSVYRWSNVTISECSFYYNKANRHGGALAAEDKSLILFDNHSSTLENQATFGDAIQIGKYTADDSGGGIYLSQSKIFFQAMTNISDNLASENGDGISAVDSRRGVFWIKYVDEEGYLFFPYCPLDYCKPSTSTVYVKLNSSGDDGPDQQCDNNRTRILCGKCPSEFGLSLGSSKCIKCHGNKYGVPIVIVAIALVAGILLVIIILVLNLTVAVGTLNSIVFFLC